MERKARWKCDRLGFFFSFFYKRLLGREEKEERTRKKRKNAQLVCCLAEASLTDIYPPAYKWFFKCSPLSIITVWLGRTAQEGQQEWDE